MTIRANPYYDKHLMMRLGGWLLVLLVLCKFTSGIGFAVMIPFMFAAAAQRKSTKLFFILLITCETVVMNAYFMPRGFAFFVVQRFILLGTAGLLIMQVFGHRHPKIVTPVLSLIPYLIYIFLVSQGGWCPAISNLKLLLFSMTFFALYGSAVESMRDQTDARIIRSYILCICIFFILGSFLLIPVPSIGSMISAEDMAEMAKGDSFVSLFKGVTCHSQTLGPMVAASATLVYADLTFSVQRKDKLYLLLLIIAPLLILKTSSRTAMGTLIAGIGFATWLAMISRGGKPSWRKKTVSVMLLLSVLGAFVFVSVPQFRGKVTKFIVKYGNENTEITADTVLSSRRNVIDDTLSGWRESPMFGNGFQVSEQMKEAKITGIKDMLSAPIEKSTWIFAVLEEGGVVGLVLFSIFVVITLVLMVKRGAHIGASVFMALIVSNLGEFTIFSMSALGGGLWALVFAGLVLDAKQVKAEERRQLFERVAAGTWR